MLNSAPIDSDKAFQDLAATLAQSLRHAYCRVSLLDKDQNKLQVKGAYPAQGGNQDWFDHLHEEPFDPSLLQEAPATYQREDGKSDLVLNDISERIGIPIQSLLIIPIVHENRVLGVVDVGERRSKIRTKFNEDAVQLAEAVLTEISHLISVATDGTRICNVDLVSGAVKLAQLACENFARSQLEVRFAEQIEKLRPTADCRNLKQDIAQCGAHLLDCERAIFLTYDAAQNTMEVDALFNLPPELLTYKVSVNDGFRALVSSGAKTTVLPSLDISTWIDPPAEILGPVLAVPLKLRDRIENLVLIGEPKSRTFGAAELQIVERFAFQAEGALETAKLMSPDHIRDLPLRVLQKLSDYLQSATDEDKIFHTLLTVITAGFGLRFNRAALFLLKEEESRLIGRLGIGQLDSKSARILWEKDPQRSLEDFDEYLKRPDEESFVRKQIDERIVDIEVPLDPVGNDLVSRAVRERQCLKYEGNVSVLPDVIVNAFEPHIEAAVVPLVAHNRVIGVLLCDNKINHAPITKNDIESLELFATTGAIAVENRRKLRALFTASNTIISPDAKDPLQELMDQILAAAEATWVKLVEIDRDNPKGFRLAAESNRDSARSGTRRVVHVRSDGISRKVMHSQKAWPIENVSAAADVVNPELASEGIQAALCLPWTLRDRHLGVMWIHYRQPRQFSAQDIADLQTYVNHVAVVWDDYRQRRRLKLTQKTLFAVTETIRTAKNEAFASIVRGTCEVLGCDTVTLYVRDAASSTLRQAGPMEGVTDPEVLQQWGDAADGSIVYKFISHDEPYLARDVETDEYFMNSRFSRVEQIKSAAAIPLKSHNINVGILFVSYRRRNDFPPDELERIKIFANHAAVAIENANLFEHRQRELDEKTGLVELSEALLKSATRREVMDAAVERARKLLQTDLACIVIPEKSGQLRIQEVSGLRGKDSDYSAFLPPGSGSHSGYVIELKRPVAVDDFEIEQRFKKTPIIDQQGIVSGLGVPMRRGNSVIGALLVHTRHRRHFDQTDEKFLQLIAQQVVIALTTALHSETIAKDKGRRAALFLATDAVQNSRVEKPKEILKSILKYAVDNLAARKEQKYLLGSIQMYDEKQKALTFYLFYPDEFHDAKAERLGRTLFVDRSKNTHIGITVRAFEQGKPQRVGDVKKDDDYIELNPKIRSEMAVPIIDDGRKLGVLNVESGSRNAFDEEDEATLVALAGLSVVVLRNSRQTEGLGQVSHDFKRPITVIQNDIQNLKLEFDDPKQTPLTDEQRRNCIERIFDSVRNLARIQSDVLSLTFIMSGETRMNIALCDVMSIVAAVITDLDGEAKRKGVKLEPPSGEPIQVEVDSQKIRQVLHNIVMNAVKFSNRGGCVQINVKPVNSKVSIAVEDNGCGIPPELHDRVFERYYRGDPLTGEGSGLGLNIAKEYVERHGGDIELKSEPGKGSTFTVLLPQKSSQRGEL